MKKILLLTSIFTVSALFSTQLIAQCNVSPANIYSFTYNGDNYEIVKENLNWTDAAACAVNRGGFLTEINTQEEQDSIYYHVTQAGISANNTVAPDGGGASYLWIGGNDLTTEGKWVWDGNNDNTSTQFWQGTSSGNPVGGLFNNWGNEPDDFGGQDGLGLAFTNWPLGTAGQWNDVNDGNTLYYIIEHNTTTGISTIDLDLEITVFPNPSSAQITILKPNANGTVNVYNSQGVLIQEIGINATQTDINVSEWANGLYFFRVNSPSQNNTLVKALILH